MCLATAACAVSEFKRRSVISFIHLNASCRLAALYVFWNQGHSWRLLNLFFLALFYCHTIDCLCYGLRSYLAGLTGLGNSDFWLVEQITIIGFQLARALFKRMVTKILSYWVQSRRLEEMISVWLPQYLLIPSYYIYKSFGIKANPTKFRWMAFTASPQKWCYFNPDKNWTHQTNP